MSDWIHALPVVGMAVVVFGGTYLVAAAVYVVVSRLATGDRARAFKGVSTGLLSPLGVLFGLLVAFVAAQVWGDNDRAHVAVNHEASALRAVVLLSSAFPSDVDTQLRLLVGRHIKSARDSEWPAMAQGEANLAMIPASLAQALQLAISLQPTTPGTVTAQREIVTALENALEARRQRVLVSRSSVNWVKWTALLLQGLFTLVTIAMVHNDNRSTTKIALGLFSSAIAVCVVLIAAHDRPFSGQLSVDPSPLLQVLPDTNPPTRP